MQDIHSKIKLLRETHNYTQTYVADSLGISQNAYSMLERGLTKLDIDRLHQISVFFGVSADFFFNNDTERSSTRLIKLMELQAKKLNELIERIDHLKDGDELRK